VGNYLKDAPSCVGSASCIPEDFSYPLLGRRQTERAINKNPITRKKCCFARNFK